MDDLLRDGFDCGVLSGDTRSNTKMLGSEDILTRFFSVLLGDLGDFFKFDFRVDDMFI
jgi:hypothetical protein